MLPYLSREKELLLSLIAEMLRKSIHPHTSDTHHISIAEMLATTNANSWKGDVEKAV